MSKSIQLKNKDNEKMYPHPYYPVGSIYLSVNNTNPSKWFGGTWEQIAKGRTLVGVDTNDTDFNTVKKTGGSKNLQKHKHVGLNWIGDESGNQDISLNSGGSAGYYLSYGGGYRSGQGKNIHTYPAGSGNSGNLQPYFTCYIWCRTA